MEPRHGQARSSRDAVREVYQHFLAVLKKHGSRTAHAPKYLYDFKRFERWLRESGLPLTLASLMDTDLLFTYRHHLTSTADRCATVAVRPATL